MMAEFLSRPLLRIEDIHHKNENTMDDRIDNLEIKIHGKHTAYHHTGKPNGMLGKHHTAKTRQSMSLAHKGHPPTPGMKGKHHSIETRRRISLAQKGKPNGMLGKLHSVKSKQKMAMVRKDYWLQQKFSGI